MKDCCANHRGVKDALNLYDNKNQVFITMLQINYIV